VPSLDLAIEAAWSPTIEANLSEELGEAYPSHLEATFESSDETLEEAAASVQGQIDTATAVLAAIEAESNEDGFFGDLGLLGNDLTGKLDAAKTAFANGDHDDARDLAQDVIDSINEAPKVGKVRALLAVGGICCLIVSAAILRILLRRRGRHRQAVIATD
jgi:hypothetical protein